jgi:hypothetical protein
MPFHDVAKSAWSGAIGTGLLLVSVSVFTSVVPMKSFTRTLVVALVA